MSRKTFGQEMQEVKDEILLLSSMVEQAVMNSAEALKNNDLEHARKILSNDIFINRKRIEIEYSIMVLIATQQPMTCAGWQPAWISVQNWSAWGTMPRELPISISVQKG